MASFSFHAVAGIIMTKNHAIRQITPLVINNHIIVSEVNMLDVLT